MYQIVWVIIMFEDHMLKLYFLYLWHSHVTSCISLILFLWLRIYDCALKKGCSNWEVKSGEKVLELMYLTCMLYWTFQEWKGSCTASSAELCYSEWIILSYLLLNCLVFFSVRWVYGHVHSLNIHYIITKPWHEAKGSIFLSFH